MTERETPSNVQEGYIKVIGGKVWYRIVGTESKNPPLLTLHGGPGFPHDSFEALEQLSDERPVIFYDQLGCGYSDKPEDKSLWTLGRFLRELKQVREELGLEQFHLLGHSWGSLLAAEYALSKPKGLRSIYLSAPFLSVPKWLDDANDLKEKLPTEFREAIDRHERDGTINSDGYKNATQEFYKRHFCRIYPLPEVSQRTQDKANMDVYMTMWGPTEFNCTGNLKGYDITDRLHLIEIPVFLSCGRYDEARPETVAYYRSLFLNAQMHIFEKSAHVPYVEEPLEYIRVVREFLSTTD